MAAGSPSDDKIAGSVSGIGTARAVFAVGRASDAVDECLSLSEEAGGGEFGGREGGGVGADSASAKGAMRR